MSSLIQCISEKYFFSKEGVVLRSLQVVLPDLRWILRQMSVSVTFIFLHDDLPYVIVTITEKNLNIVKYVGSLQRTVQYLTVKRAMCVLISDTLCCMRVSLLFIFPIHISNTTVKIFEGV